MADAPKIGVLAYQGDVREHLAVLAAVGADPVEVRTLADLDAVDGLIVPGGESTVIGKLAARYGLLGPLRVRRNAFGRQVASFEAEVDVKGVDGGPVSGAFIRAPWVADAGPEVEVLAEVDGKVVAVRQGNLLATAFHPELTGEVRLHRWLVDLVRGQAENQVGERGAS